MSDTNLEIKIAISLETLRLLESIMQSGNTYDAAIRGLFEANEKWRPA